uniref:DNA dC->dU-editing enzyme APOBEC3-like n=1 Tax=Lepisosteus oculatus TaxID=7918 RepID=W5M7A0_LEPOC|nr:PREDICTED: DNA dC->dU-editing enzyme APOBEC3-like [Lepisosteus oculatus]XP_015218856.1 PREDICTED: DNA dC->dU-editing enzyme APOBEC3-like [Lepisosteus oculatus]XP_015218857.1 PREDICTED: DNA dC->dU-editing enzyme APOBEC3-like [Lepisosteus oculatus]XP_015218858.1 PREDICTED: DNA dC->dU-editing enzyme APOBEC3-like [Lepisosteus oculatus]
MEEIHRDDIARKKHPLRLRKRLPQDHFYQEFCNTLRTCRTLLCFSLCQSTKILWDIWGYAYNKPGHSHAESMVLEEIKTFLTQNQPDKTLKYTLTLYMSFSPCNECCYRLATYAKLERRIKINVMFSKLYFPEHRKIQKGLQYLECAGVSLKVMEKQDFVTCFYLFVTEHEAFQEWHCLDDMTKQYSSTLQAILNQCVNRSDCGKDSPGHGAKENSHYQHLLPSQYNIPAESLTPEHHTKHIYCEAETPWKCSLNDLSISNMKSVKRKLFDED